MPADVLSTAQDDMPLFDPKYRWVLLFAMRKLRDAQDIDLDDLEQFDAAYGFLSTFVREVIRARRLTARLDPMRVAAISQSNTARMAVIDLLNLWQNVRLEQSSWRSFVAGEVATRRIDEGVRAADPALSIAEIERRALEKRNGFAQVFGLRARIGDAIIEDNGKVHITIEIEEEVTLTQKPLKSLSINGIEHLGGEVVGVQKINETKVKARATIFVEVALSKLASVRTVPLRVIALTGDDVRIEAFKIA